MFEVIKYEEKKTAAGHSYAQITFNRPQAMNALNAQTLKELASAIDTVSESAHLRCVLLTGEGKAFVAGADISEFKDLTPDQAETLSKNGQDLLFQLERLRIPVIAAVNGFALGGGLELAMACDFILASSKAKWGLPEVTLGLLPGYGGTQRLTLKTNFSYAKRVALSGEMFSAEEGLRSGLFAQVFEADEFMPQVEKVVEAICERAPIAVRMTKASIQGGVELGLEKGYQLERRSFYEVFKTADKTEGVSAFLEKRKPNFLGQ